jgi:hypothetical protein
VFAYQPAAFREDRNARPGHFFTGAEV